jgi:hypothetical protein
MEIRSHARVFVVTRSGVSYLLRLHAVLLQVCRAVLVRLSHRAKLLPEVRQHRLAARLRLLSPHHQWLRRSTLQRQSL